MFNFVIIMYLFAAFVGMIGGACGIMYFLLTDELEVICKQIAAGKIFKIKFNTKRYNYDIENGKDIKGKFIYGGWYNA